MKSDATNRTIVSFCDSNATERRPYQLSSVPRALVLAAHTGPDAHGEGEQDDADHRRGPRGTVY